MAIIPVNPHTTEYRIESKMYGGGFGRPYLGMSSLGAECIRALFFGFRWASRPEHSARAERIFRRGDIEEARVIADLKGIDINVFRRDGERKIEIFGRRDEQEELVGYARHCLGHPDGRCENTPEFGDEEILLEIKTMNDKYYGQLIELGIKEAFPTYWGQLHRYMGGMGLSHALFCAHNKNDEARKYIPVEFDKSYYGELIEKEVAVITSEKPPRAAFSSDFYKCSWCSHYNVCHYGKAPEKNCRTCQSADICDDGKWECSLHNKELSVDKQKVGCEQYRRLF